MRSACIDDKSSHASSSGHYNRCSANSARHQQFMESLTCTCSLSHSSLTFFQSKFRLPCPPLPTICMRFAHVVRDSVDVFSSPDSENGWMKGGGELVSRNIMG
jgi:hypothetical protein